MKLPTLIEAKNWLAEADQLNPGPWVAHSQHVARAARLIAQAAGSPDPAAAEIAGLVHDLGRREGYSHLRHVLDGYHYVCEQGFPKLAEVCLTHSFPDRNLGGYFGERDVSAEELIFLENFLICHPMTPLDRLIQLCDSLALPEGCCLLEKRFVDVALRYGTTTHSAPKWRAVLDIKREFEERIGVSIYSLLPGTEQVTFGL